MAKRLFDFTVALVGLIVLSPAFLLIAVVITLTSAGPVFHRAQRIGLQGKPFTLLKFRSMIANASRLGPGITAQGDPRVTCVGRTLRRTKLDELPQLLNVLRGEMSLVGPRPEDPRYVALYTDEQHAILSVRPGITSPASLTFRHEEDLLAGSDWETRYRSVIMPRKLTTDLAYLRQRNLWTDLCLIVRTILALGQ